MTSRSALATTVGPAVIVESKLFGELATQEDELFEFPSGLFGFPECQSFVLLAAERPGVYWLQSADHAALAFLLVDPFIFFEGYSVDLQLSDRAELGIVESSDVAIFAIVTLPRTHAEPPTGNLRGPLALNMQNRRAKQLAVDDPQYDVRAPLDLNAGSAAL